MQRKQNPTPPSLLRTRSEIEKVFRDAGIHRGSWARSAGIRPDGKRAEEGESGGIEWILTTEKPTVVWDWERWDFVEEILLADGMIVPAIGQVSLLDCHDRSTIEKVHGHVREFGEAEAEEFLARTGMVIFADDHKSQVARDKVFGNHITDGSVGYQQIKSVWVPEDEQVSVKGRIFDGPVRVTYQWLLKEFSLTPIGADVLAKARLLCGA